MKIKDFSPEATKLRKRLKRCQALLREFRQHRRERYRLTGNVLKVIMALRQFAYDLEEARLCEGERADLQHQIGLTLREVQLLREGWLFQDIERRRDELMAEDEPSGPGGLEGVRSGLDNILLLLCEPGDLDTCDEELWSLWNKLAAP